MIIKAGNTHFESLNKTIRQANESEIILEDCTGQRYIGSGLSDCNITISGTPGNALGAYLNGSNITVLGNAQDATGDTMNDGCITIHGSSGDATGYAMRGGRIYVKENVGYRAGIHMKAYEDKVPVLVVGGCAGSFLGEYQAGGIIVVLGIGQNGKAPVGNFCGTGMHGGKIFIRCDKLPGGLPSQVNASPITKAEHAQIVPFIEEFCQKFNCNKEELLASNFYVLTANTKNPYKQLYIYN